MNAKAKAEFTRRNHARNGGRYTTDQLAEALKVRPRTIRAYLLNELAVDPKYRPKRVSGKVDHNLVVLMAAAGVSQTSIARQLAVSQAYISNILKKAREKNEQTTNA